MLWRGGGGGGRADKISNKLAGRGDVACTICPGGSMAEHQPRLLGSRVRFPARTFAIFPFLPKLHLQFPFLLSLPFPFPFPLPSTFRLCSKRTLRYYVISADISLSNSSRVPFRRWRLGRWKRHMSGHTTTYACANRRKLPPPMRRCCKVSGLAVCCTHALNFYRAVLSPVPGTAPSKPRQDVTLEFLHGFHHGRRFKNIQTKHCKEALEKQVLKSRFGRVFLANNVIL